MSAPCDVEAQLSLIDVLPAHVVSSIFCTALQIHEADLRAAESLEDNLKLRRRDPRRVLPLVSKAFLQATLEAAGLWARVQLNVLALSADRLPRFLRWLDSHAPAIRSLVLYGRPLPNVAAALSQHFGRLAAAVQKASRLERLDLWGSLGVAVLARIDPPQLPCLRAVGIDLSGSSCSTASSKGSSSGDGGSSDTGIGLRKLELATANLLMLPALSELLVQSLPLEAGLLARHPSLQRRLQRLHFAEGQDVSRGPSLGALACLAALTSLRFNQRDGFELPGPLTALPRLAHLHAAVRYRDDPLNVGAGVSALTSLRALWLQHAAFDQPASLAALPGLHTLGLVGCAEAFPPVLAALAGSSQLAALHLEGHASAVAEVPPATWEALGGLRGGGLTRLELPFNRLRDLPSGGYLAGLQVLDLSQNSLGGVPMALAGGACPHLSALSLGQQEAAAPGEAPAELQLLAGLAALRLLVSSSGHYSAAHLSVGLRSPAEAAHLARLRGALPRRVRVTNQQAEFERATGRLQALFEVKLREERL